MPTVSAVFIANLALSNVGSKSRIESFDEQTKEARTCKQWYDFSRQEALEARDWSFARKRITLATSSDAPPLGWVVRYAYPSDCLKIRRIQNPFEGPYTIPPAIVTMTGDWTDPIPFAVEMTDDGSNKSIICNLANAIAVYTFDQTNTIMFSRQFIKALSHQLAANIAMKITGDKEIMEMNQQAAVVYTLAAGGEDANEAMPQKPRDTDWIRGR